MHFFSRIGAICLTAFLLSACGKAKAPLTAQDLKVAREAMSLNEVSLMLRSGSSQQHIIAEISRRHVVSQPDAQTETSLVGFGAKPGLVAALKNEENILTPIQKEAYDQVHAERDALVQKERAAHAAEAHAEEISLDQEQRKKTALYQQTVANAAKQESREDTYWKLDKDYREKKKCLDAKISSQQGYINRLRGYGYQSSELAQATTRLEQYKDELSHLQEPIR